MDPFFGRVRLVKVISAEPATQTAVRVIAPGSGKPRTATVPAKTRILSGIEKLDGPIQYTEHEFVAEQGEWRYATSEFPKYRAMSRVEFRPEHGDATMILRTHLDPGATLLPVKDAKTQFDIAANHPDATTATQEANQFVTNVESSLKKIGLNGIFKIIKPAEKPAKPLEGGGRACFGKAESMTTAEAAFHRHAGRLCSGRRP